MNLVRMGCGSLLLLWIVLQTWTQWLAYHYGYHALLGTPWWQAQAFYVRHSLYPPWRGVLWTWQWGTSGAQWGLVAGALGLALTGVLLAWKSNQRGRTQPPPMTGHGTTQWATRRDIKKAGLL